MTPDQFRLIEEIYQAAADLPAGDRAAYLDSACNGDASIRREVGALLADEDDGSSVMEAAVGRAAVNLTAPPRTEVGRKIGPYRVLSELGRGGMGAVYKAVRDDDTFKKEVAIKVVRGGVGNEFLLSRFRHERRMLATLEHPNIARVLDGGETDDAMPYLVMEYVNGVPIHQYARENRLDVASAVALFRDVCAAVENAHRNLIIHRDIKPGNILVTKNGVVKLLDFGIAKLLDPPPSGRSRSPEGSRNPDLSRTPDLTRSPDSRPPETETLFRMLTPDYSSPEQIRGEAVTTATDVYSLGAVLYELLTGEPPCAFGYTTAAELQRMSAEMTIRPPSQAAPQRGVALDLDLVVIMALRKEAERRYPTVAEFSEDLRRYLEGLPVSAREDTLAYRVSKFLRRYKAPVAAASLVVLSLVGGMVIAARQARKAELRFGQVRGFARTVLFDLHRELENVPGAARARLALVRNVENYLNQVVATGNSGDAALQSEFAAIYLRLGEVQTDTQKSLASYEHAKTLLARKGRLTQDDQRTLASIEERTGDAMIALGKSEEAYAAYDRSIEAASRLLLQEPKPFEARLIIANAQAKSAREYMRFYKYAQAQERLAKAIATFESLLTESPENKDVLTGLTTAQQGLATIYMRRNRLAEALDLRESVFEHRKRLAAADPGDFAKRRDLMRAHLSLGNLLGGVASIHLGNFRDGIAHYRDALEIAESLVKLDPESSEALSDLGLVEYSIGGALEPTDAAGSMRFLRRSYDTYQRLRERDPKNMTHVIFQAGAEAAMGNSLLRRGRVREAIAVFQSGQAKYFQVIDNSPNDRTTRIDLLILERTLALALAANGERAKALAMTERCVEFARQNAAVHNEPFSLHMDLPRTYEAAAAVSRKFGDRAGEKKWLEQAAAAWDDLKKDGSLPPSIEVFAADVNRRLAAL